MPSPRIGRALRRVRSRADAGLWGSPAFRGPDTIAVSSAAFDDGGRLDARHRGAGAGPNTSPALLWTGVPPTTQALLLVIEDVDVPLPKPLVHTAAVLSPTIAELPEGGLVAGPDVRFVTAGFGRTGYHGPRPLPGHGPHRYRFEVFALDCTVPASATKVADLESVVAGHVLARGYVTGTDER